jgi:hypothetical protein
VGITVETVSLDEDFAATHSVARWHALELWHLLSLDAPLVAAVWTWFVARAAGAKLPWMEIAAMFCAVWVLYAADRLLDARLLDARRMGDGLEERHVFHAVHRRGFLWGIAAASLAVACLLPSMTAAELRLYGALGALLAGWFVAIHAGSGPLPKELAVGVFFAAAVFVPAAAREPGLRDAMIVPAGAFAAVCWLNCVFIHRWEHDERAPEDAHRSTLASAPRAVGLAVGLAAACLLGAAFAGRFAGLLGAVGLAGALLVGIDRLRDRLGRTTLRALADAALLTPLVLGWWR